MKMSPKAKEALKEAFNAEARLLYFRTVRASKGKYKPNRFIPKLNKIGGWLFTKELLSTGEDSQSGLQRLADLELLHLSPEFLVTQPQWSPLFTKAEQAEAFRRLDHFNFDPLSREEDGDDELLEGAVRIIRLNAYERNRKAVELCKKHYGTECWICDFDSAVEYGDEFSGLIHVHHLKPLAEIRRRYVVDPIKDLRPVCPNCHAALHSRRPQYSIKEFLTLRKKAYSRKSNTEMETS